MKGKTRDAMRTGAVALVNRQRDYAIPTASLALYVQRLRRRLRLGREEFNVCFVDDRAIRRLNFTFRSKDRATDVLSFPWTDGEGPPQTAPRPASRPRRQDGITHFLGEVVISVPTARRHAARQGHSTLREIQWLILHGLLHLLGYDHERDKGEMVALELLLREHLGVTGFGKKGRPKSHRRMSELHPASR